jgi:predicted 3-demethylubiquinone-9 3-methyltransferase (glyoxalase superfamily)
MATLTQKITPFLWFDNNAEEAAAFYVSVFPDAVITSKMYPTKDNNMPEGKALAVSVTLLGMDFTIFNGGPHFTFDEAVSFMIHCDDQKEIDYYWERLIAGGGAESMCGWLKDKFGLSWQVTPRRLLEWLTDGNGDVRERVMKSMMTMQKLDLAELEKAANG